MKKKLIGAETAQVSTSEEQDVVQMILNDRKSKLPNASDAIGTTEIDEEGFFLDNNRMGAMYMSTLKNLFHTAPASLLKEMELVIQRMNEGVPMNFKALKYGNGDIKYHYVTIRRTQGSEQLRMPAVDNVVVFMILYLDKKISCNFTMKELYEIVKD